MRRTEKIIKDYNRYNRMILISYVIGFQLYGFGVSYSLYYHEAGFFRMFPIWQAIPISIIVLGLTGGWYIAGLVGGIWLGYRFIRQQNRNFIILACVFFSVTLAAFQTVGLILAVPLAIRNIILIKKAV